MPVLRIADAAATNCELRETGGALPRSLHVRSLNFVWSFQYDLPLMHQKNSRAPGEIEKETLSGFWVVEDMMTFENIGFSNTLDRTKFLICCDCEMGPVGYHNIDTRVSYVALSRVRHVD